MATELKVSSDKFFRGDLVNIGRGGALLKTTDALSCRDFFRLRISAEASNREDIILTTWPVWGMVGRNRNAHWYGLSFLKGQDESYERLRAIAEIAHARTLADSLGLRYIDLTPAMVEKSAFAYIDRDLASSLNCIPVKLRGDRLMLAMSVPDLRVLEKLRLFSRCNIFPMVATRSAIRYALNQCWKARYVPSPESIQAGWPLGRYPSGRKIWTIALVSTRQGAGQTHLAVNMTALLTRLGKRAVSIDEGSGTILLLDERTADLQEPIALLSSPEVLSGEGAIRNPPESSGHEDCEWRILDFPTGMERSNLDRAVGSDEIILVVMPEHWIEGCQYIQALFQCFVESERQGVALGKTMRNVLDISVVSSRISEIREGFKIFKQIEVKSHDRLDMAEPGFDLRLHYIGGILNDPTNIRRAEKMKSPVTTIKPRSPAAQCMIHIVHSLLKPIRERDPRIRIDETFAGVGRRG